MLCESKPTFNDKPQLQTIDEHLIFLATTYLF